MEICMQAQLCWLKWRKQLEMRCLCYMILQFIYDGALQSWIFLLDVAEILSFPLIHYICSEITISFYHQLPIVHHHDRSSPTGRTVQGMIVRCACPSRMLGTRGTRSVSVCIWPVLYFISFFLHSMYRYCVIIVLSLFIWLVLWTNKLIENITEYPRCIIKNWPVCLQLY